MSGLQIFLLVIGFIFITASLFLVDGKKKIDNKKQFDADAIISNEDIKSISDKVNEKIEDIAANHLLDTDDKLSSITNEKIIAICDYTDQLFAKLENNHQEVIFLYNMLQDKEEEMKSTLNRMEVVRKENQAFMDKIAELRNQKMKSTSGSKRLEDERNVKKEQAEVRKKAKPNIFNDIKMKDNSSINTDVEIKSGVRSEDRYETVYEIENNRNLNIDNKNDKILELYKSKKSLLEISKILGIGQGEVKLVIDLYGKGDL